MESLNDKLAKIVISYNQLRAEYHGTEDISNQDLLMGYRDRFVRLQGEIIPIYKYIVRDKVRHDEKACSTIKARIARGVQGKRYEDGKDKKGEVVYKYYTWATALNYAASTDNYATFLKERVDAYEVHTEATALVDSIQQYINTIASRVSRGIRHHSI